MKIFSQTMKINHRRVFQKVFLRNINKRRRRMIRRMTLKRNSMINLRRKVQPRDRQRNRSQRR